jgi:hypothetical protein
MIDCELKENLLPKIDKLDIADEMLDAAIEEYLDKRRGVVALNLAGVAQELYDKALRINNEQDTMSKIADESFTLCKQSSTSEATLKEFKKIVAHVKNAIKHFDSTVDRYIDFDPNKEARLMIAVALNDKAQLNRSSSDWDKRFKEFATIYNWYHTNDNEE